MHNGRTIAAPPDLSPTRTPFSVCRRCHAPLDSDQRYCVECGRRRGPLPLAVAELIGGLEMGGAAFAADPRDADGASAANDDSRPQGALAGAMILSRPAAAVAVMALLALGVVVGAVVSPPGQSGAADSILVAMSPTTSATTSPPPVATSATPTPEATAEPTPSEATPAPTVTVQAPATASNPPPSGAGSEPSTPSLPPITHVFLIVLSDQGFTTAFGPRSPAPYLSSTLAGQGELIDNYYGVTSGELANEIGLISGQGPTPQTAANCPTYADIIPGTLAAQGQVLGSGCVSPRQALTVGDQLSADGRPWAAYIEGMPRPGQAQPTTCPHPPLAGPDPNQAPTPANAAVTWRNPFLYFHSVIDNTTCTSSVTGLEQLAGDLASPSKTPALAYIVPDRCHDGSDEPCALGRPAGLQAADSFLRGVVPEIEASAAYKQGGLIAITFDQAPQSGANADSSGCCLSSAYPNLPAGAGPAGTVGASGASGAAGASAPAAGAGSTSATGATGSGGPTGSSGNAGVTGSSGALAGTPPGGGRVGLLLISKYVKPGSVNVISDYNHFSLLASIEDLFGLGRLGYAGSVGLPVFDASVYNAGSH